MSRKARRSTRLVGALLGASLGLSCAPSSDPSPDLASVLGSRRVVEPRLSVFDAYVPCSETEDADRAIVRRRCSGSPEVGSPAYEAASTLDQRLRRGDAPRRGSSPGGHLQGLLNLVWVDVPGALDAAIEDFEQGTREDPENAVLRSDLAAAYLVRALEADDPLDLLHALELVERSLELDGELPEALFNRALTLEKLYLRDMARDAWDAYLAVDSASGWAAEALEYRDRPAPRPPAEAWEADREALRTAALDGDEDRVRTLVDRHRAAARLWGEDELLGAWATKHGDPSAGEGLAVARAVGTALAELGGEHLLHDAVTAIDRAAGDAASLGRLVDGHRAYARGLESMAEGRFEDARPDLASASAVFDGLSPFHYRARFMDQRCAYRASRREEAARLGLELAREAASSGRYPVVAGRALWVAGTSYAAMGRPGPSEAVYLKALELFRGAGETDSSIAVATFLGGDYDQLGDAREAWRLYLDAARQLDGHPVPTRQRVLLLSVAFSAADLGEDRAALLFTEGGLALARLQLTHGETTPDAVATRLWHRAGFLRRLGRYDDALAAVAEAHRYADQVVSPDDLRTLRPEILLEESRTLAEARPEDALAVMEKAAADFQANEDFYVLPGLLRARAGVHLALDDPSAAEADVDSAIGFLERQRAEVERPGARMSLFERTGAVYEDKLALQLRREASAEELLATAEQARSRVLLDWWMELGDGSVHGDLLSAVERPSRSLDGIVRELPEDVTVLSYEMLDDRLLSWIVRKDSVRPLTRAVHRSALESSIAAMRDAPGDADLATRLWQELLAPVAADLEDARELLIVADEALHALPFAALRDPESGRLLIEDHRLVFAPSLQAFAELREISHVKPLAAGRFLVVADPAFDPELYHLGRLDGAAAEAANIEGRFADVEVLADTAATPSALLAKIGAADVFHYAGHALANWSSPLRSSLVMASEPGEPGSGTLLAGNLLGQRLEKTRLVVLSACDTAYGGRPSREGVVGLVWPFLARGVPAVVASLWPVDDQSTAVLFESFYQELAEGVGPAEALRRAQLELAAKSVGSDDWAAFQTYGTGDS